MARVNKKQRLTDQWDRREGEGTEAFEAFKLYRDMGESRTIDRGAEKCRKSVSLLLRWSGEHGWVERVQAYDDHLDKLAQKEFENERKKIARRQAKLGLRMQEIGTEALETYAVDEATLDQIVRLLKTGVDIERTATGSDTLDQPGNTYQMAVLILPPNKRDERSTHDIQATTRPTDEGTGE
jgi:hypothetical protein